MKLKFNKGTPKHKGYYLVRAGAEYRLYKERDRYPEVEYWNGEKWQNLSDNDAFDAYGNDPVIVFPAKTFPEWMEVEIND